MLLVRYIIREHLAPFFAALFVITFLFVVDFLVHLLDSVFSKGLPFQIVLEIFVLNLAWMLALSVPMACLVASLMAFGRLSADHEITAVKAAGIPPFRMMRPVLLLSSLVMVLLIVFNNWILPEANHRAAALMSAISRKKPHAFIDAGRLLTQFPGVQIWIDEIDPVTGTLRGIQIFEFEDRSGPKVIMADSAHMDYQDMGATIVLNLHEGENHILDEEDEDKYFRIRFRSQELAITNPDDRLQRRERKHRGDREMPIEDMLEVTIEARKRQDRLIADNSKAMWGHLSMITQLVQSDTIAPKSDLSDSARSASNSQNVLPGTVQEKLNARNALRTIRAQELSQSRRTDRVIRRIEREEKRISQYWVEIHKKFSIPVACVVFVLIGAPLGIMARKGGIGTGVIYSLFFFVLYWACLIGGENLADKLYITPAMAMWTPNVLIGLGGIVITLKMTRDNYSGNSRFRNARFAVLRKIKGLTAAGRAG